MKAKKIEFSVAMRAARIKSGETLEDIVAATGITKSHLSRLENGRRLPGYITLKILIQHFNIDPREIF